MEGTGNLSLSRNVGKSGNVEIQANNKGTEVPQKQMFNLKRFALFRYTNISIIFEFSKYNSLILNWFR